jgi:hypothetical protein
MDDGEPAAQRPDHMGVRDRAARQQHPVVARSLTNDTKERSADSVVLGRDRLQFEATA